MKLNYNFLKGCSVFLGVLVITCIFAEGCAKEDIDEPDTQEEPQEPHNDTPNDSTSQQNFTMKKIQKFITNNCFDYYYWHDEMDSTVRSLNLTDFESVYSYFDATLYPKDRWSWMADGSYFAQTETGEYQGTYGASIRQQIEYYGDYDLHIAYVYPGSPFDKNGVKRGWTLTHIAGRPVMETIIDGSFYDEYDSSPQTFTFTDHEGNPHTFTTESATLETHSSLKTTVFQPSDFPGLNEPIGYFHYLTFNANMLDDINDAMKYLKAVNVHKLILDLRYNGGGDSRASELLINYLAPASANNKPYVHRSHNKQHTEEDIISNINRMPGSLDLDALYVIGSSGTASASEMLINGLKPYLDLTLVGDTTYGKPNGMYVFMYPNDITSNKQYNNGDYSRLEYVFLPICFYNKNGVGDVIPDDGFIPDNYRPDDLTHDFGVDEDLIKACLTRISGGDFPELPKPKYYKAVTKAGFNKSAVLKERRSPLYGLTIEPFPGQMAIE